MKIPPTVGRVVLLEVGADQPHAALVTYVHDDEHVNLCAFDANGIPNPRSHVTLYQGEGDLPPVPYAKWMPYQLGQAQRALVEK